MTALVEERSELEREVARRRTFAIISHPDAGKTTLTEKLMLYGGAIDVAGAVRTRRGQRHATSDWLAMEQTSRIAIASITVTGLDDPMLEETIGPSAWNELRDAAELLSGAGAAFDRDAFARGTLIPVFFGSAINNFGVEPFLRAVLELAPKPLARGGIDPKTETFTGFVFKIQANMDKRHRDRL